MQVQSLALTIAQLTDEYGHLAEQLVDTAVKQVINAMDDKRQSVDQANIWAEPDEVVKLC